MSVADVVVLVVIACVLTLIVRGMLNGRIRTCDCADCTGDCASCGHACAAPRIHLSRKQRRKLRELARRDAA